MDLDLTDDQQLLRDTTARFIEETLPLGEVRRCIDDLTPTPADYVRQSAELGWFSLVVPEELGGGSVSGRGIEDAALVAFERGKALQPGPFAAANAVALALAVAGSDEQRAKVLPAIVGGEAAATWAVAGATGDVGGFGGVSATTRAGGWVLDGAKALVPDPGLAGWILVTAGDGEGVSQFLLAADTPGLRARPLRSLDVTRRFGEVVFDAVEVGPADVVGEPGGGRRLAEQQLDLAAALTIAESVGAMRAHFEMALQYAKDRVAFGRPIGSFQAVKHLLADTSLLLESSTAMAQAAVEAVQDRREDASEVVSMAKAYVGDCGITLAQNCFQVFGGIGFTWEHDNHLFLRRLTTDAQLYGDPAWHRERLCTIHGL